MTDQLISFETAKLAKEKGFAIISRFGNEASLYDKKGKHVYYANYGFMYSGLNDGYTSAPSQSLLQKWLREKHNIHLQIESPNIFQREWICHFMYINKVTKPRYTGIGGTTYEEALEIGLLESLKLL